MRRFIVLNQKASMRLSRLFPHTKVHAHELYLQAVAEQVNALHGPKVVDLGAGKSCPFADRLGNDVQRRLIGMDLSADEMAENEDLDQKIVGDATARWPFEDEEIDVVVSRSALEHFVDLEPVTREIHRVLKDGGYTIHAFPSKYAPFSLLNRILPRQVSLRLLRTLRPGSEGLLGFPAYYDHCSAGQMEALFKRAGFSIVETKATYQSAYFAFFVPLHLVGVLYEFTAFKLGLRELASTVVIVAQKPIVKS